MIKFKDSLGNLGLNFISRNKSTNTKEMADSQKGLFFFSPVAETKALPKLIHRSQVPELSSALQGTLAGLQMCLQGL